MEKLALFIAYCGAGYKGMQRNPGANTIESALEEALVGAGALGPNGCSKSRLDWKRAARTDKEVSAAGQVVSARFYLVEDFVNQVNAHLPPSIRLLGLRRVPDTFNAKSMCASRRYEYVLPAFALNPSIHRGRKAGGQVTEVTGFEFDEVRREEFNRILSRFHGTHSFHNFSWHVRAKDREAERTVISVAAEKKSVWIQGVEFIRILVHGKSFVLYQIRKMVGLAVAVMRQVAPVTAIDTAFRCDVECVVPTAPEVGLLLEECLYDQPPMQDVPREVVRKQMEEFKASKIYPHIASSELQLKTFEKWLPSLNVRNYPAFS